MKRGLEENKLIVVAAVAVAIVLVGLMYVAVTVLNDRGRDDMKSASQAETADIKEESYTASYTNATENEINIMRPEPGMGITSPLKLVGEARGSWYFEADAPVFLVDWDGKIIAQSYVTAQGEWMTEDMVPFEGSIEFDVPEYGERGSLIFMNDNPSGMPENDRAVEIPVFFKKSRL